MEIQSAIRASLTLTRQGIAHIESKVSAQSAAAVEALYACEGRVVLTGMGKAGLVARKIAATLASTGTPAFFLHPAEAIHGDLGMVRTEDVVMALSNSGETEEILALLPHLRGFGVRLVAMTGNSASTLARQCDIVLDVGVPSEADPLGIAPTASTTAMLAMGDAIASALVIRRGFTKEQYARFHPGGSLGRALLFRVADLMHGGEAVPLTTGDRLMREAICAVSSKRLGAVFVVDKEGSLEGIITDGDIRRILERHANPLEMPVRELMTREPKTTRADEAAVDALRRMEAHAITVLPVVDDGGRPVAALHMHDLVRAGLALWPAATD